MSVNSIIDSEVVDIHGSLSLVLKGEDGESAYEVAVRNGFVGTEEEWLNSLKGEADRAEAATAEALVWRNSAKDYAVEAGNHEEAAKGYRNECQTIKDSIAPQVTQAITAIQAEKAEAEAKKALVDEAAAQAHLDRVQADADAAEVRYLHGETVEQKNIATDAAERARRYAAREFNWEDLNERPTTRDDFPILDVPKVDGTDATGTWDIDITGDAATVNGHTVAKNVPANAVFTDTTYSEATTSQAGLLSATDKAKLNGIESGAQVNTITGVKGNSESTYRTGNVNITKANIGLGNVDNTADIDKSVASAQTANNVAWSGVTNKPTTLEGYGITNAPTKTGTGASGTWDIDINGNAETVNGLTVETAVPANAKFTDTTYDVMTSSELSDGTSTQGKLIDAHTLATFILTVAADVVNNAPEALDTLAELAQALGDDPNFATTVMNEIGKKLDKSGGVITGNLTVNGTLTGDIVGSASTVNGHTVESDVPANAVFTDTTYSNATTSKAGLMSSADKTKLNGIESGAQVNTITGVKGNSESNYRTGNVNITKANIGLGNVDNTADSAKNVAYAATAGDASTVSGFTVGKAVPSDAKFTDTTYNNATISTAGLMSAADKEKLDGIASGAQVNSVTGVKGNSESSYRTGNVNITKANIGLGNVDNTADNEKSVAYAANAGTVNNHAVNADVPSGAKFTDTTYSAMSANEATTGTATTARTITAKVLADYVAACIANLVNSAPATLDTLKELADALGDDPNFATTMTNALAEKLGKNETAKNAEKVNNLTVQTAVPVNAVFTDTNNATAQNVSASNDFFPVLMGDTANSTSNIGNKATKFSTKVNANPSTGELRVGNQVRLVGTRGCLWRADTSNMYFLYTDKNNATGLFTDDRPFILNFDSGRCIIKGTIDLATKATALYTARMIDGASFDGTGNISHYAGCTTAKDVAAKTVINTAFSLVTGARITVNFYHGNTATSPTLNVSSTGAKNIVYRGGAVPPGYIRTNGVYELTYNGTNFEISGNIEPIEHSAPAHNGIYRGDDITSYFESGQMSTDLAAGNFTNIYIGDYIIKSVTTAATTYTDKSGSPITQSATTYENVKWYVVAINPYLGLGSTGDGVTSPHVMLMPDRALQKNIKMNPTDNTAGGYLQSDMWRVHMPIWSAAIKNAFGQSHVLTHQEMLSNVVDTVSDSKMGAGWKGSSAGSSWVDVDVNIPNEVMVTGESLAGDYFDAGEANARLPFFALRARNTLDVRWWNWTRTVASTDRFVVFGGTGGINATQASEANGTLGIAPYFLLY